MINKPCLVRLTENLIINLQNVNTISLMDDKLYISQIGDDPDEVVILQGDEAKAMWIYFASSMMSVQPLRINPGRETLDIPKSTDAQSH